MAMLAEARRKQKFSFDPRNLSWSNDENKFGHKLMEKMGWSKGKGLGANEDGNVDHVAVSVKNDTRGVGCSKSYVDNWIAHQDDFNALLANLGQDHKLNEEASDSSSKVTSLEHNSKTSKGRLHYQKFTKGKDLSLKSESDLDCVFGKRKSQSGTSTPQMQSEPNSDNDSESSSEANHGIPLVTSTDSVQEYFKKKMAEKLSRLSGGSKTCEPVVGKIDKIIDNAEDAENDNDLNTEIEKEAKSKSKKKSKKKKYSKEESNDSVMVDEVPDTEQVVSKKSKKKNRKGLTECEVDQDKGTELDIKSEETARKKKSKKKSKSKELDNGGVVEDNEKFNNDSEILANSESHNGEIKPKKKKSKKRKHGKDDDSDERVETKKKTVRFSLGVEEEVDEEMNRNPLDEKVCLKMETCDRFESNLNCDHGSSTELAVKEDGANCKNKVDVKKLRTSILPELIQHAEAFNGSNIHCVSGYVGMPTSAYDVKRKLANHRRKAKERRKNIRK